MPKHTFKHSTKHLNITPNRVLLDSMDAFSANQAPQNNVMYGYGNGNTLNTDHARHEGANAKMYKSHIATAIDITSVFVVGLLSFTITGSIPISLVVGFATALIVSILSIRVLSEWDRTSVLRLGNYAGIVGPGLYATIPFVDTTPVKVDTRAISTGLRTEKALTKDNVPLDVDATLLWRVNDAESAILNLQSYSETVLLASQTAIRDVIARNDLETILDERDKVAKDIKGLIGDRVKQWGIEAISLDGMNHIIRDDYATLPVGDVESPTVPSPEVKSDLHEEEKIEDKDIESDVQMKDEPVTDIEDAPVTEGDTV